MGSSTVIQQVSTSMGVHPVRHFVLVVGAVCILQLGVGFGPVLASDPSDTSLSDVGRLIERLGSDSYATRLRAKDKLQRLGLEAFDELHSAQYHPDSEIAMAARHLVSSLLVSWSKESDSPEVREALDEYGAQGENERGSRIEMLAELPARKGLAALVRLTRFETSLRLSRRAALSLMQQPMDADADVRRRHAEVVRDVLGANERQAAQWLRVYAEDLAGGGYSSERWRKLVEQQRLEIDSAASGQATRPSVLELVRVCATRAAAASQRDEALRLATANLDLIPPTTRDLIDACSWAIDNDLHPFVLELRQRHLRMFDEQPVLLYGAAEAMMSEGDSDQADQLAEQALQVKPLPKDEAERAKLSPKEIEEIAHAHREIGQELESRGLFHWAEREFRQIVDSMEVDSKPAASARIHLARMLGELQRHDDVVEILGPLTQRIENDEQFKGRLNSIRFAYNAIRSDIEFHRGLAKVKQGEIEAAKPMLTQALEMNPENIDILIAMYRLNGGAAWNESVGATLKQHTSRLESLVGRAEIQARQAGRLAIGDEDLASILNQYAWLISNTEGDFRMALKHSQRSLELNPDEPALLDTCARCYFAVGDFENAVRTQRRAVRLMPHSPPMLRQLAEFESHAGLPADGN